jgi:hypothetical protein
VGAGVYWYKRWQKTPKKDRNKFGKQSILWLAAIIVLCLVLTGRAPLLMGVLAALLALAGRAVQLAQFIPVFKKIFGEAQAGQNKNANKPAAMDSMGRQEAADILGVDINASDEDIKIAHKKLIQKMHPDRGGSDALAKQINLAKDLMLK